ncbi:glyoxalase [Aurantibacter aestuarii]|uniref:Glyoxalase n=1 Tax=Aurantibacter aestuarii TaxID=1266046 RepID=A0A2T1N8M6_9FLAO|nr:glyoxalase [Aurantibacter aestuarii]PSG88216.1 glyoxalase [Aurantibacter aestuarii]
MENRNPKILSLRPLILNAKVNDQMKAEEQFQNATLRPIIKFQNDLILEVFRNYVKKHKNVFYEKTLENRLKYIDTAITKDIKFRNALKGMVIGHFTLSEYKEYIKNSSALNKRMMNLVKQRLQDQIQLLEMPLVDL